MGDKKDEATSVPPNNYGSVKKSDDGNRDTNNQLTPNSFERIVASPARVTTLMQMSGAVCAPAMYLVLYTAYDICAAKSAQNPGGNYLFEPMCVVLCVELGKLLVSMALLLVNGPSEWPSRERVSYQVRVLTIPAVCYSAINVINLVTLAKVSLSQYGIWYQMGIFFNAVLWYVVFRRPFGSRRLFSIGLLFLGCFLNAVQPGMHLKFEKNLLLVIATSMISAVGCVGNEYFFKKDSAMDINLQNSVLYVETSLFLIGLIYVMHPERLLSPAHFFVGFQADCLTLLAIQIFIGLTVSRILKYTSVITKNYVMALHVPIEVVLAHRFVGSHLSPTTMVSAFLIGISTCVYYSGGATPSAKGAKDEKAPLCIAKKEDDLA